MESTRIERARYFVFIIDGHFLPQLNQLKKIVAARMLSSFLCHGSLLCNRIAHSFSFHRNKAHFGSDDSSLWQILLLKDNIALKVGFERLTLHIIIIPLRIEFLDDAGVALLPTSSLSLVILPG